MILCVLCNWAVAQGVTNRASVIGSDKILRKGNELEIGLNSGMAVYSSSFGHFVLRPELREAAAGAAILRFRAGKGTSRGQDGGRQASVCLSDVIVADHLSPFVIILVQYHPFAIQLFLNCDRLLQCYRVNNYLESRGENAALC